MIELKFRIPGECRGKMRPKASAFGGHAKVYTPAKQVEYENWVRLCFKNAFPDFEPIEAGRPIEAHISVFLAVPQAFSKKKRKEALEGIIKPTRKPDVDNAAKSVLDSLNGISFHDDAQIVSLRVDKAYGNESWVDVELKAD